MTFIHKLFFLILLPAFVFSTTSFGQDIQFSQFYGSPLYLNPAFTGSAHNYRAILHQRLQWPSLDAKYTTTLFSLDGYSNEYKSGLGLVFFKDVQGKNIISSTEVAAQ